MNAQMERLHDQSYETDPHNAGLHSVVKGEEGDQRRHDEVHDHEKKSVLKKVKAKAKKIKDTITKHAHVHNHDDRGGAQQHDQGEEEEDDEEELMDEDLIVHVSAAHTVVGEQQTDTPAGDTMEQRGVSRQLRDDVGKPADLREDPSAPKASVEQESQQSKVVDPTGNGGKEIGIAPVLRSLDKMKIYDEMMTKSHPTDGQDEVSLGQQEIPEEQGRRLFSGSHDQLWPEPVSDETRNPKAEHKTEEGTEVSHRQEGGYTEKIAAVTSLIVDKAAQATNVVASKLGYGVADESHTQHEHSGERCEKGVTVKGYIAEKLKPSEEDKALAEAISGALHKPREEEVKGKVTESEEVVRRLGKTYERAEGKGVVDTFKSAVTSWFGRGGETNPGQAFFDYPKDPGEDDQGKNDDRSGVVGSEESPAL